MSGMKGGPRRTSLFVMWRNDDQSDHARAPFGAKRAARSELQRAGDTASLEHFLRWSRAEDHRTTTSDRSEHGSRGSQATRSRRAIAFAAIGFAFILQLFRRAFLHAAHLAVAVRMRTCGSNTGWQGTERRGGARSRWERGSLRPSPLVAVA